MLVMCAEYPAKLFDTQGDWVDTYPINDSVCWVVMINLTMVIGSLIILAIDIRQQRIWGRFP